MSKLPSVCPVCSEVVENVNLEQHVNDHFAAEEVSAPQRKKNKIEVVQDQNDEELARQLQSEWNQSNNQSAKSRSSSSASPSLSALSDDEALARFLQEEENQSQAKNTQKQSISGFIDLSEEGESSSVVCDECGLPILLSDYMDHLSAHELEGSGSSKYDPKDDFYYEEMRQMTGMDDSKGGYMDQYVDSLVNINFPSNANDPWNQRRTQFLKVHQKKLGGETIETYTERLRTHLLEQIERGEDTEGKTKEVLPLIRSVVLDPFSSTASFTFPQWNTYLCDAVDFFNSSYGDRGWGCGYRNIQMVASHLLSFASPALKRSLFGGTGLVPSIPSIQTWLQKAWNDGFDREGAMQLGNRIEDTRKWIGTTEACALFRSFGVQCSVIEFAGGGADAGKRMMEWVKTYFTTRGEIVSSSASGKGSSSSSLTQRSSLVSYFSNKNASSSSSSSSANVIDVDDDDQSSSPKKLPLAPLYLQHDGHSRTIVGVEQYHKPFPVTYGEEASGASSGGKRPRGAASSSSSSSKASAGPKEMSDLKLLIFDPAQYGSSVATQLREKGYAAFRNVRRLVASISKKNEYQLLLIESYDPYTARERDQSKIIRSIRK